MRASIIMPTMTLDKRSGNSVWSLFRRYLKRRNPGYHRVHETRSKFLARTGTAGQNADTITAARGLTCDIPGTVHGNRTYTPLHAVLPRALIPTMFKIYSECNPRTVYGVESEAPFILYSLEHVLCRLLRCIFRLQFQDHKLLGLEKLRVPSC